MKKIKIYIIVLFCFAIWIFILGYITENENLRTQKSVVQYILIDQFHYWKYVDSEWQKLDSVNNSNEVSEEISWKKYDIYVNNHYFNTLDYVFKDGEEYYFDDDTHSYEITQEKILLNNDTYLSLKEFSLVDFSEEDVEIVNHFLKKNNYPIDNLTVQNKYLIDDSNVIYVISNYPDYYTEYNSNLFYIVFYRRGSKNYVLLNIGYIENFSSYRLSWVVDVKNKLDNFILSYTCEEVTCYNMYEYQNGKYVKVIGN